MEIYYYDKPKRKQYADAIQINYLVGFKKILSSLPDLNL